MDATSFMLKYVLGLIKHSICLSTLPLHGGTLHATLHGNPSKLSTMALRSHDLWQRLFLIHKSQKDQFKIHEQSVLLQPVISVTVGQWRHGATERKVLPPLILQEDTNALKHVHIHVHTRAKGKEEVLMGILD